MVNKTLKSLSVMFQALSDPTRLAVLEKLSTEGEASATELSKPFNITLPAILKHLRVLELAGLISQKKHGKARRATLNSDNLQSPAACLAKLRDNWERSPNNKNNVWEEYRKTKSPKIRENLVKKYLYLVKYVAGRMSIGVQPKVEFNELVSYGIQGLFDAINKYDTSKDNKFEAYAASRIRNSITESLRKQDWASKLLRTRAQEIDKKCKELEGKFGRLADDDELAKVLKISTDELNSIYRDFNSNTFLSLDKVWQSEDKNRMLSRLRMHDNSLLHVTDGKNATKELLASTIDSLNEREKLMFTLYYYENMTLKEIGKILGVSESRVCQIHTETIMKLRRKLADSGILTSKR